VNTKRLWGRLLGVEGAVLNPTQFHEVVFTVCRGAESRTSRIPRL
jgi:hypothetical protein